MKHRATHIARANSRFMSYLQLCTRFAVTMDKNTSFNNEYCCESWPHAKEISVFYAVARREKEKCEPNRCIEVVRIGCEVIQQPDPSLRMVDTINGLPMVTKQNRSRRRQEATLLCRRHAVLCGIDFQRAVRREGTCFDDDADYYPSYAVARSVGRFAKKRAASLISSIRRPGNMPSKLLVELMLEDTH